MSYGRSVPAQVAERASGVAAGQGREKGHLYIQTNEMRNHVIHYLRTADGKIREAERAQTGGAGSGPCVPVNGTGNAADVSEGAESVIVTPDQRFLFAVNGGDNSVSSFRIGIDGRLTLLDAKRTGNVISGSARSLVHCPAFDTLFVLHARGPDHIRLMSVEEDGALVPRPESYTVNTMGKPDRVATMAALTADEKFLVVGTTFDQPAAMNPDGSPILWVERNGTLRSVASNSPDPDGLIVFGIGAYCTLREPKFEDGGGRSPGSLRFLHHRPDRFIIGYALDDGLALARIDEEGAITAGPLVGIDTSMGRPSEVCSVAVSPDDRWVFAANRGYGYITSFRIEGNVLCMGKDPACSRVPGDGALRALNGTVSSNPANNWMSPDGKYLYQLYPNASKLVGYAIHPDGSLEEVTNALTPRNSPHGLTGFGPSTPPPSSLRYQPS